MRSVLSRSIFSRAGLLLCALGALSGAAGADFRASTLAGDLKRYGNRDGRGEDASFPYLGRNYPTMGLALDEAGNLYLADSWNHSVRKVSPAGWVTTIAGAMSVESGYVDDFGEEARFKYPSALTRDRAGNLVVSDGNYVIRRIDSEGRVTTIAGAAGRFGATDGARFEAQLGLVSSMAYDAVGDLYFVDQANHSIRKLTTSGMIVTVAGGLGEYRLGYLDGTGSAARFYFPSGLCIAPSGLIYVSDTGNNCIRCVTPAGVVSTYVGTGDPNSYGSADGVGAAAKFSRPGDLTSGAGGELYVADGGNGTIRRVGTDRVVTTLSGVPRGYAGAVVVADGFNSAIRFGGMLGFARTATGVFYVVDSDGYGVVLRKVEEVNPAGPTIQAPPAAVSVGEGAKAMFTVTAWGYPTTLTYRWQCMTLRGGSWKDLSDGGSYSGATTSRLQLSAATTAMNGDRFRCIVSNGVGGATTSGSAELSVSAVSTGYDFSTLDVRTGSSPHADGLGTARFATPLGVARHAASGRIYVVDGGSDVVRRIEPDGTVSTYAGRPWQAGSADGALTAARFGRGTGIDHVGPRGAAIDAAGNLYLADAGNHTIRKISADGLVSTLAGSAGISGSADGTGTAARFNVPSGIAVDSAGNLFITDTANHLIRKCTAGGVVTTVAGAAQESGTTDGTGVAARFFQPQGIAVDVDGTLYVADTANHAIRKINSGGGVSTIAGLAATAGWKDGSGITARFRQPTSLVVDGTGGLVVVDSGNHVLRRVSADGAVTTWVGTGAATGRIDGTKSAARFITPFAVALASDGTAYVSDSGNSTVRKISPLGWTTTLAGNAGGSSGGIYRPQAVAVDANGNVYVACPQLSGGLAKIAPTRQVTFLANPGNAYHQGIAVDRDGVAHVVSSNGWDLTEIFPSGLTKEIYTSPPGKAYGCIAVAVNGDLSLAAVGPNRNYVSVLSPSGDQIDWAGDYGAGSADGTRDIARFRGPEGIVWDREGNAYVADTGNHTIRKFANTLTGDVTTIAGSPGVSGSTDGTGAAARFNAPRGIGIDPSGSLIVVDSGNHTLRRVTPGGVVTTIAGAAGITGNTDGAGAVARFNSPFGLAVDRTGVLFIADTNNDRIRVGIPRVDRPPALVLQPSDQTTTTGRTLTLSVAVAEGAAAEYLWQSSSDGGETWVALTDTGGFGGTHTRRLTTASLVSGILFRCLVSNETGTTASRAAQVSVVAGSAQFSALSTRAQVGSGSSVLIPGFVISGGSGKRMLVRALGPKLREYGLTGELADPRLNLTKIDGRSLATSDDWNTGDAALWDAFRQVGLPDLTVGSKDSALIATLSPGVYTAIVSGANNGTGVSLVEFYDLDPGSGSLAAISTRAQVGTGSDVLIPGIVIDGSAPKRVLIRVGGPNLAQYFSGYLADPQFEVKNAAGTTILTNDNWDSTDAQLVAATSAVGAGAFATGSKDAALVADLAPGLYTIVARGVANTSGVALVELFEVP